MLKLKTVVKIFNLNYNFNCKNSINNLVINKIQINLSI